MWISNSRSALSLCVYAIMLIQTTESKRLTNTLFFYGKRKVLFYIYVLRSKGLKCHIENSSRGIPYLPYSPSEVMNAIGKLALFGMMMILMIVAEETTASDVCNIPETCICVNFHIAISYIPYPACIQDCSE